MFIVFIIVFQHPFHNVLFDQVVDIVAEIRQVIRIQAQNVNHEAPRGIRYTAIDTVFNKEIA